MKRIHIRYQTKTSKLSKTARGTRKFTKEYKKVVYEEESDSEPEAEESQYIPEEEPIEQEIEQKHQAPKKNKIFEYLNKDAKGNKQ